MQLFEWDSAKYSVHIQTMDQQHQTLFALLNNYYEAIIQKKSKDGTMQIIRGLLEYIHVHFSEEEKLMRQYNYPGLGEQLEQHKIFINKIEDVRDRFDAGKLVITVEITTFLKEWLVNHIAKMDKKYSDFFLAKGIK